MGTDHVDYSQRNNIKSSLILNGGELKTVVITAPHSTKNNEDKSLWQRFLDFLF